MSFEHEQNGWYRPLNPNEHTYTEGYGFSPRPPFVVERQLILRYSAAIVLCLVGYMFLLSFLTEFFNQAFFGILPLQYYPALSESVTQLSQILAYTLALTVPFFIYAMYIGMPLSAAVPVKRVRPELIIGAVLTSLAVSAVANYASDALHLLLSYFNIYFYEPMTVLPSGIPGMALYVLNVAVTAAVFEEIAFRGVVMQSLRRFGDSFALLCSSAVFALVHISPVSMPHAFLMGLIIGYFVLFTGSLHTGMVIHFVYNLLMIVISQLSMLGGGAGYILFFAARCCFAALGLAAIILLMKNYRNMFLLKNSTTINTSGEKLRCFFCTLPFFMLIAAIAVQARAYLL